MYALVTHGAAANGGTSTATTPPMNTTGAALLIAVSTNSGGATLSDTKGNAWVLALRSSASGVNCEIWFTSGLLIAGPGHQVSASATASGLLVLAFSASAPSEVDQTASNAATSVISLSTGSVTPTAANELLIAAGLAASSDFASIDSGFTLIERFAGDGATVFGSAAAYQIQTAPTTRNPTFVLTAPAAVAFNTGIATFKERGVTGQMLAVF